MQKIIVLMKRGNQNTILSLFTGIHTMKDDFSIKRSFIAKTAFSSNLTTITTTTTTTPW